jgi:transposase
MKNNKEVVGIHVSKKTIDAYCYHGKSHKASTNDIGGYKNLIKWVFKVVSGIKICSGVIPMVLSDNF